MYQYTEQDRTIVFDRVAQFRHQTERFLSGELDEQQFLPLRLQNGLYIQRLAPMLRIAVPYGMLRSDQLRELADISRTFDKGYVHVTTRQNIQLNWPQLEAVPDILERLANVDMHAVQTSGACIRNVTTDAFAGVADDERVDPRPLCELIRQWSTFHPEFAFLPRKFKIAVASTSVDRAAIRFHDIGIDITSASPLQADIYVGGGLGRTPVIGTKLFSQIDADQLLNYLEAIIRVYNLHGRRDNKYKARIKILLKAMGAEAYRQAVENELANSQPVAVTQDLALIESQFSAVEYASIDPFTANQQYQSLASGPLSSWLARNTQPHQVAGYRSVVVSTKIVGVPPGDLEAWQLDALADLADLYSFGELRTTHEQNVVLADVPIAELAALHAALVKLNLAEPVIGTLSDMICCPGGDYCSLANAKSIPIAQSLSELFKAKKLDQLVGDATLNISGCMNACGHHHIGDIGILGVDKKGAEFYQISLGGRSDVDHPNIGAILGPSVARDQVDSVISNLIDLYIAHRSPHESLKDWLARSDIKALRGQVYEA